MKKMMAVLLVASVFAATAALPAIAAQPFYIRFENWPGGRIHVVKGPMLVELGHTLVPVGAINPSGFTASGWGKVGCVTATAVNAIHIKVGQNDETHFGKIFSLMPKELLTLDPANYKSYYDKNATLFTDIPAGTRIFGGGYAPVVGSRVLVSIDELERASGHSSDGGSQVIERIPKDAVVLPDIDPEKHLRKSGNVLVDTSLSDLSAKRIFVPIPTDFTPKEGDVLVIEVAYPERKIQWIEFDNSFGGLISVKYVGKDPVPMGQVLKPVAGVGRFEGTLYCGPGRIRADHPGVIDVSTSPLGVIGGFQIIPRRHAMSPEMYNARLLTQWMVVGPLDALDPSWEGTEPLFSGYIYPSYISLTDPAFTGLDAFLGRFHVTAKMRGQDWGEMPVVGGRVDDALKDLAAIRIWFPLD
jgi:hypothetical protein